MKLTSEQVHHYGGAAFVFVSLLLLLFELGLVQWPWLPYLLPLLLVGYGVESFLDTWIHGSAAPAHYGPETAQHLFQGSAVTVAGIVEILILVGVLEHPLWGLFLPAALVVIGAIFFFHAQHDAAAPGLLLVIQHRIFAVTLFVAAAAKAYALIPGNGTAMAAAWLLPLLLFGLEMLIYTEGSTRPQHAAQGVHQH